MVGEVSELDGGEWRTSAGSTAGACHSHTTAGDGILR